MHESVIQFWFDEIDASLWWKKDETFDELIAERFGQLHQQASQGELYQWRSTPEGRLAEIIILDQFSRNIYRDTPKAFSQDPLALCLAQTAVDQKVDQLLSPSQRSFLYMPYMHSESLLIHDEAVRLYKELGNDSNYNFEIKHREIIERFGRYPHRNYILNRPSTEEELKFLTQPGSSF